MDSKAVDKLPKCSACGDTARYLCKICERPFCQKKGCPDKDQHHPAGASLVEMAPYPWE